MVLAGLHAVFDVLSWPVYFPETNRTNAIASLLGILLPLGLWFLIAQSIFEEALPGDRQFWLTRPYRWGNLLTAKILFVLLFGSVPLFLSDCYILGVQRLGVFDDVPTLLLHQALLAALFLLPAFALATLTSGLLQFVLAWFVLLLATVMETVLMSHGSSFVVSSGVPYLFAFTVTFIGVALWQYAQRRTTIARAVLLAVTCSVVPVITALWQLPFFIRLRRCCRHRRRDSTFEFVMTLIDRVPFQGVGRARARDLCWLVSLWLWRGCRPGPCCVAMLPLLLGLAEESGLRLSKCGSVR